MTKDKYLSFERDPNLDRKSMWRFCFVRSRIAVRC